MPLCRLAMGIEPSEYYDRLFEEHGLQHCEVYVDIPSHPVFLDGRPWSMWAIGADMDDAMEKATHVAFTALCSQNLAAIEGAPISLYPIQGHSDPEWKARKDEVGNIFQVHYHSGWAYMAGYAQHLFQLQHNTQCIVASSDVALFVMPRRSRTSPRRSVTWPRRKVSYVSRLGTWRVAFTTRRRHF
jgi:hypothetical protein